MSAVRSRAAGRRARTLAALLAAAAFTTAGAPPGELRLARSNQTLRWSGGPLEGVVPHAACAAGGCSTTTITLDLDPRTWAQPGGVQIGIRWPREADDLDLYVEGPDGRVVAESVGIVSSSESVLLTAPANGAYRVTVVPSGAEPTGYEAFAQVERPARVNPVRDLLPDLVSLPARNVGVASSAYLFDLGGPSTPNGCYPEEMAEQGARRCLRFDQIVGNDGAGPFELRYRMESAAETQQLTQRIHRSDGTYRDRFAATYEFHPAHAHFHYREFGQAHLWRSNAAGRRLGSAPERSGRKNGFCMVDVENHWFARRGDAARTYIPPSCLAPTSVDPDTGEVSMVNGISAGWADVYNWHLADQYIEISGLAPGWYLLETVTDPGSTIVESDERNNSASALILCTPVEGGEVDCALP